MIADKSGSRTLLREYFIDDCDSTKTAPETPQPHAITVPRRAPKMGLRAAATPTVLPKGALRFACCKHDPAHSPQTIIISPIEPSL